MKIEDLCFICLQKGVKIPYLAKQNATYDIKCPNCGNYNISISVLQRYNFNENPFQGSLVSHWIRTHQTEIPPVIDPDQVKYILENEQLPKPSEQINNLILWIGDNQKIISEGISISYFDLIAIVGGINQNDVKMIANHLEANKYITLTDIPAGIGLQTLVASLTFPGWERYYELKNTSKNSKLVFMAMQYRNDILNNIFNEVIVPAVKNTGYDIRRLDQEKRAGLIDDKLRVEIRRSKFLISDLSNDNNGAYWEAGYAEGLGMPVIYICEENKFNDKNKPTHFDANHNLTVQWKNDPESLKKFAEELKATIRATFPAEAKMED